MKTIDTVKDLYDAYKEYYDKTGEREYPDRLLALLLLDQKDKIDSMPNTIQGEFYNKNKNIIDENIQKIENDFNYNKESIIEILEEHNYSISDYEEDKIWGCYAEGFMCVHWGLTFHNTCSAEKIYDVYMSGRGSKLGFTGFAFGETTDYFYKNIEKVEETPKQMVKTNNN